MSEKVETYFTEKLRESGYVQYKTELERRMEKLEERIKELERKNDILTEYCSDIASFSCKVKKL